MIVYKCLRLVLLLMLIRSASANCPAEQMKKFDNCVFTVACFHKIKFDLPEECKSADRSVSVNLTIYNPSKTIAEETDTLLLENITSLRITGHFENTNFAFLEYLPRLKHLYLVNNKISVTDEMPFYHLYRLETLDLSYNSLNEIKNVLKFEGNDNMLKRVSMKENDISVIDKYAFEELKSLVELDLSHNEITELDNDTFSNLLNLQILNLNGNNIVKLNKVLNGLTSLRHLYLRGNKLEAIDVEKELHVVYHLQTLDVSDNMLAEIKPATFLRHSLHLEGNTIYKILMSGNNFVNVSNATDTEFSAKFTRPWGYKFDVDVLTEIDMSDNDINNIEYNAFLDIQKIISLDLSVNNIQQFKLNSTNLNSMSRLNLSRNELTHLEFDTFSSMIQLENLDVSHNFINEIADDIFKENINLKYINFTFNDVKEIDHLQVYSYNSDHGILDFSNNELSKVTVGREMRLARLYIQSNKITNMSDVDMSEQNGLQHLQITNNLITFLNKSCIRLPETLVYLDVSYNEIETISPSTFVRLDRLVTLRLTHNKIQTFEFGTFQGLKSLRNLDLAYNQMVQFSSKMVSELKILQFLSLAYNDIVFIDYTLWIGHKYDLHVYIEGNKLSCEWLGKALKDYYSGYSRMRPSSHAKKVDGNSVDGIPCTLDDLSKFKNEGECEDNVRYVMADERLLMINKKIFEAIKEQTHFLQKCIHHSMQDYKF